jgi:hypothetical protein
MKLGTSFVLASVLCATAALAEHDPHQKPTIDPAMMEAMMKAGQPGDAHKKLDAIVGTWDTKITLWMVPGADPMSSSGVSEARWVLGGRYLQQEFKGDFEGMPFEGMGYTGYDNVRKRYWGSWIDNMSTAMMTSTGSIAEDGKSWSFSGTMPDPMSGADTPVDEKITIVTEDHHTMEMWTPGPDGKKFKSMEIVYTRKK